MYIKRAEGVLNGWMNRSDSFSGESLRRVERRIEGKEELVYDRERFRGISSNRTLIRRKLRLIAVFSGSWYLL